MKRRTIIIIVIAALVLAGAGYGVIRFRQSGASSGNDLITYQIDYGDLSAVIDETGSVRADQSATLYWQANGVVGDVHVTLGQDVKADQVLAEIDPDSLPQSYYLAEQELITATNALEDLYENAAEVAASAQSALASARDALDAAEYRWAINQPGHRAAPEEIEAAKARKVLAKKNLDAAQTAYDNAVGDTAKAKAQLTLTNAINQYQYATWYLNWIQVGADDIEMGILDANLAVAAANLEAADRYYDKVKDGPNPDDIRLAEARVAAAQASLNTASITAPFDGVITAVDVIKGDLVFPNTVAFRIDDLENLRVDVEVSEVDISQIDVGQPVTLEFDAIQDVEYQGEVIEVSPVGIPQQGLVSFRVSIRVTDADEEVRPGLTAAVQVVVRQVEGALLVPNRAVRWVKGEQVVYISPDGEEAVAMNLIRIPVVLGASSDEYTEVLEGDIEADDFIVLNPPSVSIFEEMEHNGPPAGFGN